MVERLEAFHGDRLRLARLFQALSLEEVGARVAATRQYIHQLETGAKSPTGDMVAALAEALEVEPRFFEMPLLNPVREDQCHFRKRMTTPTALVQQAAARGTLVDLLVRRVSDVLEMPAVNFPDIPVGDARDVERAAEACRVHWGLGLLGPITNMTRVVENAGAVVTHFVGLSERVDALSMHRQRPIIVRSSAKESLCRLRFDIAHECGHLVMHQGIETGDRETEDQANQFASAFLLPRAAFTREFPRRRTLDWKALFELKLRWKVSVRASVRRAYDLGLLDAAQYRRANVHLVETGHAKGELYDDDAGRLPLEQPELLDHALATIDGAVPGGLHRIAKDLGLRPGLFGKLSGWNLPAGPGASSGNVVSLVR